MIIASPALVFTLKAIAIMAFVFGTSLSIFGSPRNRRTMLAEIISCGIFFTCLLAGFMFEAQLHPH